MNTSSFMDKQIMDLTAASQVASLKSAATPNNNDYIHLVNHRRVDNDVDNDEGDNNLKKEDIQPSYDFKPIRPIVQSSNAANSVGVSRASNLITSSPPPPPPPIKNNGSVDSLEPVRGMLSLSKDKNAHDGSILPEIDGIMKKYTDNLLHALEGVSARMTQLETRTSYLENSVDDINVAVGNNHGSTDGKLRHLENILREVQTGVQVLRDKHEIIEAQLELSKLQFSHTQKQSEKLNTAGSSSTPQTISAPLQETTPQHQVPSTTQQGYQQLPPPALPPTFSMPQNAIVPTMQSQPLAPPLQMPNQFPQNQVPHPSQYPIHGETQEAPKQNYQHTPTQQPPPSPPHTSSAPHPQYPGSYAPYSQPPHQQTSMPPFAPPQGLPPANIHQEEASYIPSQSYGPPPHQPLSHHPSAGSQSNQYYGPPSQVYDLPPPRSNMGYPSGYGPSSGPNEPYPYGGSAQYGGGSKPPQAPPGGSGYPQLPTAQILPQAIPTASAISGGSGSSQTGNNRAPVDDVIDKVSSMGFSREQVRATVRRLTENGQSVDLNIVLDKLMNG